MHDAYYVYILATRKDGPIYVGSVTILAGTTWLKNLCHNGLTIPDRGFAASGMTENA